MPDDRRSNARRRLHAAAFASSFDRFVIPPLLVPMHEDLGISLGAAALAASAYFVAYGVGQPAWGALSDRLGRTTVMRLSLCVGAVSCVVATVAGAFWLLVAARTVAGLFFGGVVPAVVTYIGDTVASPERPRALAVFMAWAMGGVAVGTLAGGLAAEFAGWRWAFAVSGLLAACVAVSLRLLPEPVLEGVRPSLLAQVGGMRREGWVGVVVALAFVEGAVIFGSVTYVAASLQHDGVGAAVAGSAAAAFGLATVLATPLVTRAIPRVTSPRLIAGGSALAVAGSTVAAVDATIVTALIASCTLGAGLGFLHPALQMWATEVYPDGRALTISLFAAAIFTGAAVASAAAAPLADAGNFGLIFLLAALGGSVLATAGAGLRSRYLATAL